MIGPFVPPPPSQPPIVHFEGESHLSPSMLTENSIDELQDDDEPEEPSVGHYLKRFNVRGNVKQKYEGIFQERLEKTDGLLMDGKSYSRKSSQMI